MRLINVRKGQFVYYKNELHKVYSVQPFFRRSIHLSRLKDLEQIIVTAKEITYYRPKHLDSFIYNGKRYTLDEDTRAVRSEEHTSEPVTWPYRMPSSAL